MEQNGVKKNHGEKISLRVSAASLGGEQRPSLNAAFVWTILNRETKRLLRTVLSAIISFTLNAFCLGYQASGEMEVCMILVHCVAIKSSQAQVPEVFDN